MSLRANPAERATATPQAQAEDRRALAPIAASALVHIIALVLFFLEQALFADRAPRLAEEVPFEVVSEPAPEPPPQPQAQEPPPEPEPERPKEPEPKEKPPRQRIIDDDKPAFDAPRSPSQETLEREAPDRETKAMRRETPNDQRAAKPAQEQAADPQRQQEARAELEAATPETEEDKPEAEVVEQAQPKKEARLEEKQGQAEIKASPEPKPKSIADQLASLEPTPEFKFGGSSKPAPVGGGSARASYYTILFGLIVPRMHIPPHLRNKHPPNQGELVFWVDGAGHLTHQALYRSSGFPELDAAALAAVRGAAPFPPPPDGASRGIVYHFYP